MSESEHSKVVSGLRETQRSVYDAIIAFGPITDHDLAVRLGEIGGGHRARRLELVELGLVREAGATTLATGRRAKLWGAVPSGEVAEARARAAGRRPRRRRVRDLPLETRLAIVRELLRDSEVNAALLTSTGRGYQRARARTREDNREREQELRDLNAQLRRDQNALSDALKLKRHLLANLEVLRGVHRFLGEEEERRSRSDEQVGEPILDELDLIAADILSLAESIRHTLGRLLGRDVDIELDPDDAIEIEDAEIIYELAEGEIT